ncbi:MAG TPA: glucuronate isomerase [Bacteroidales bacterium]|nr:glucuronate isomerase [Bacteroidales bacterium]HOR09199.1 glucuronate isomerase [Bacteroidales bacterium]HPK84642.1 glucuronate isomerase [Bacteroidales bacterium]
MKEYINDDFLLQSESARKLYHEHSEGFPIIDYHCHLSPEAIANDRRFEDLGQLWLEGDHYKWRAMRANGIDEKYITGKDTSFREKYDRWAETVPMTMRNPLYAWTHLELKRVFGVGRLLNPDSAAEIWEECTALLQQPGYSARGLMKKFNVEVVCTTDDPIDSLEHHKTIKNQGFEIRVLPAWRPDKAMSPEDPAKFIDYINELEETSGTEIRGFASLIEALRVRHAYFAEAGCVISDHGIEQFHADDYTEKEVGYILRKVLSGSHLENSEISKFKSAMLYELAVMDSERGWVQQFHYGAIRNNNSRMLAQLGPDAGYDSIGDFTVARSLSKFLDRLDAGGNLAKTILYNLNPRDNELIATMAGNFQDGPVPGKIQFGAGWWFLDQETGMINQLNTLSLMGLLSRFTGMLTDSRSFVSYPRHEYFRRILCNMLGDDIEKGKLPESEMKTIGKMVEMISYYNARDFFGF